MRYYKSIKERKSNIGSLLMFPVLLMICLCVSYFLAGADYKLGFLMLAGIIGMVCTFLALRFPVFGFYLALIYAVFFADLKRFSQTSLPVGTYVDIVVLLTFVGVLIQKILQKQPVWKNCNHPIVYVYALIIVYSILQIFNPNGLGFVATFPILRRFLTLMLVLYCSIQLFRDIKSIEKFIHIWIVLGLIVGLYACYAEWFGYPKYQLNYIESDTKLRGLYSLDNGNYRKFSFLPDPVSFGILMSALSLMNVIILVRSEKTVLQKIFYSFSLLIMLMAMSYSGTRTAFFSFSVGLALYIGMNLTNTKTLLFACVAIFGFFVVIYGPIYGNATINRIRSTFEFSDDASMSVRDRNRKAIQPYLHSHPFGGGLGTTGGDAEGESGFSINHPLAGFPTDSGFLRMGLEYGWIGLIIQCFGFFLALKTAARAYFRSTIPANKNAALIATVVLFSYVVSHFAQIAIGSIPGAFLFYPMIALVIRIQQLEKTNTLAI